MILRNSLCLSGLELLTTKLQESKSVRNQYKETISSRTSATDTPDWHETSHRGYGPNPQGHLVKSRCKNEL